jgi:hypothetical protein
LFLAPFFLLLFTLMHSDRPLPPTATRTPGS